MIQTTASALTAERFALGKTFGEYLDSGINNRERFIENYERTTLTAGQTAALKALAARDGGPHHIAVIGEDWCPDVYRATGVAQRIAEAIGAELRYFERDQNKDLIAEFLKDGEFEAIPVFVFYDREHREIAHFIERPTIANEQLHLVKEVLGDNSPGAIAQRIGHEPSEEEVAAEKAAASQRLDAWRQGPVWANWRVATIDEVIALLEQRLG